MYLTEIKKTDPGYGLLVELDHAARNRDDRQADAMMLKCLEAKLPYELVRKVKAGNYGAPPPHIVPAKKKR